VLRTEWISKKPGTFCGSVTANTREHTFPLGAFSASIVPAGVQSGLLFPERNADAIPINGWSKNKRKLNELSCVRNWTLHDLRRTFATIVAAPGTPIPGTEKLLKSGYARC
jgi:integrase